MRYYNCPRVIRENDVGRTVREKGWAHLLDWKGGIQCEQVVVVVGGKKRRYSRLCHNPYPSVEAQNHGLSQSMGSKRESIQPPTQALLRG